MLGLIKKILIRILASLVSASSHTKFVILSNQKCTTQPTIINLHLNGTPQGLHYHLFVANLDRCVESCNTLIDLSNKVCAPNKTKFLNLNVFNIIKGKNELKTLIKHISCVTVNVNLMAENVFQIKSGITINFGAGLKNIIRVKKIVFGILLHVVLKMINIQQVLLTIQ